MKTQSVNFSIFYLQFKMTRSGSRNQVFGGRYQAVTMGKTLSRFPGERRDVGWGWQPNSGPGWAGEAAGGQLPCVGSSVIYTESAVLPRQGVRAGLALAVDIQAQGGFCLPVQAEALWL